MSATINTTVLMSGPDFFDDGQAINPFMTQSEPIDLAKAKAEHDNIRKALQSAGVTVIKIDPPSSCQDGVYSANWALVRGDKAILTALPGPRQAETPYAAEMLVQQGKTVLRLPDGCRNGCTSSSCAFSRRETDQAVSKYGERSIADEKRAGVEEFRGVDGSADKLAERCGPLRFSGQGDALPCGNLLFCGSGYRSDVAAQEFVAKQLGYQRIQLRTVPLLGDDGKEVINTVSGWPDSFYYDIDLAISILRGPTNGQKGLIAWCPEAFTPESQATLRALTEVEKIEVSLAEAHGAFACNLVSTGEVVIMNDAAPQLASDIEAHGLRTIRLNNPELGKGGGSIRCTTLTLDNR